MTLSFHSLGISEARSRHLESLGFEAPTPIQVEAIPHLLSGRDVVGQAQTGTGKTAAFSLPMLEAIDLKKNAVQALVLTPTRELAVQVCQSIRDLRGRDRVFTLAVYGGQSIERQIERLDRGVHIVVGTPGRVMDLLNRGCLKVDQLTWLVLDEADEMLNMGFIQDVEKILSQLPADRQTTFFSATMAPSIRELVTKFLRSPVNVTIKQPKAAPSRINQVAYMVPRGWSKARALQPIMEMEEPEAALIFVRTKQTAADLTSQLQAAGYSVDEYHGNLSQTQRERLLLRFRQHQIRWVVATDIAARGLDVDHLTHVINYDLPDSIESYVHRIGRTGRAGKTGTAISLIQNYERGKLRAIERHVRQTLEVRSIPSRAQIEARQLDQLKTNVLETLTGERLASFLPIVAQLSEEYEPRAIAAAALQMAYDATRPAWAQSDRAYDDVPEANDMPKPRPTKRQNRTGGPRSRNAASSIKD
ncbi:DEAD/DEAH box helicase [Geitlerinema sp. PCC 7407]|uniref:DEAD/DEAH box helicase n=1 Tax=Geitlerinema sp. PCC 7407 TaxID=1173025 RepID=UPI00029F96DF|nr:DEAD/DEAH box helicase [Geitlerinema sp. PCC 7407]AFY67527.1 DEAD/DEAH box helicase domain protein [Geitlerinema sp. PCC 7407]